MIVVYVVVIVYEIVWVVSVIVVYVVVDYVVSVVVVYVVAYVVVLYVIVVYVVVVYVVVYVVVVVKHSNIFMQMFVHGVFVNESFITNTLSWLTFFCIQITQVDNIGRSAFSLAKYQFTKEIIVRIKSHSTGCCINR